MENKTLLSDELLDRVSGGARSPALAYNGDNDDGDIILQSAGGTISSGISFPDNSISNGGGIGGGIINNIDYGGIEGGIIYN